VKFSSGLGIPETRDEDFICYDTPLLGAVGFVLVFLAIDGGIITLKIQRKAKLFLYRKFKEFSCTPLLGAVGIFIWESQKEATADILANLLIAVK